MKQLDQISGVKPRMASFIEGETVLAQIPEIRERLRYRGRWELRYQDRWLVRQGSWARSRLTHWRGYGLVGWKADCVLTVLKDEGRGLPSDDPNSVLTAYPEYAEEAREFWMPKVRRLFKCRGRTYYELCGRKWEAVPWSLVSWRLSARMHVEAGFSPMPKSHEACLEELAQEGHR